MLASSTFRAVLAGPSGALVPPVGGTLTYGSLARDPRNSTALAEVLTSEAESRAYSEIYRQEFLASDRCMRLASGAFSTMLPKPSTW